MKEQEYIFSFIGELRPLAYPVGYTSDKFPLILGRYKTDLESGIRGFDGFPWVKIGCECGGLRSYCFLSLVLQRGMR